jgi:pilus assembly protein CpaC
MFSGAKSAPAQQGFGARASRRKRERRLWGAALLSALVLSAVTAAQSDPRPVAPGVPVIPPSGLPPFTVAPSEGVSPAAFLQPEPAPSPKVPGTLPQPNLLPFGDDKVRLPRLGPTGQLGTTPVPTEKDLEEYRKFVEGVIDPKNTLDLIEGRTRIILLKATPFRTQIGDPSIATFRILEPDGKQMTMIGQKPGITVLNLWFTDPMNKGKETILSYLVRVLPDPEAKERLEAIYKALEGEINKAFPNSRVRLTLVGDKLMVTGQAHDVFEATQILRILRANAPGQGGQGGAGNRPFVPLSATGPTGSPFDPLRPAPTPGLESYDTTGSFNVINNLRVPGEQQVMLRVVVAEINRAAARSIGLNFSIINNRGTLVFGQHTGGLISGLGTGGGATGGGLVNLPVNLDNGQIPPARSPSRT